MAANNQLHPPNQNQRGRAALHGMNFLVVDDMPAIREMLRHMLVQLGVQGVIAEAGDGLEAIDKLKETHLDFIICDINMPRLNGIELHQWVRSSREFQNIPFLMITGEVSEETVAAAVKSGLDGYLLKPFHLTSLKNRILEIIPKKPNHSSG
ncbi:MAG: response regulator [Desulfobacteraceae bacterium]